MSTIESKKWTYYLPYEVYLRLAECRTIKEDLPVLLHAKWQWAQDTGRYNGYIMNI